MLRISFFIPFFSPPGEHWKDCYQQETQRRKYAHVCFLFTFFYVYFLVSNFFCFFFEVCFFDSSPRPPFLLSLISRRLPSRFNCPSFHFFLVCSCYLIVADNGLIDAVQRLAEELATMIAQCATHEETIRQMTEKRAEEANEAKQLKTMVSKNKGFCICLQPTSSREL